jgi:hypothetical protein
MLPEIEAPRFEETESGGNRLDDKMCLDDRFSEELPTL